MTEITVKNNAPYNGTNLQDTSPFERRQNTFRQLHNREVANVFSDIFDIPTSGTPYDPSKITPQNSPRRVMRADVLIDDGDSFSEMWLKRELVKFMKDDDTPIIFPHYDDVPITAKDKPHVHLYFQEKRDTANMARRNKVDALISFRLMNKTVSTVTRTDLNELRREINTAFPSTFVLNKGRLKYSYRDKENGFEFILALRSETEAKEVITKVLSVTDKLPDWDNLRTSTSEQNFDLNKTINILSVNEKLPKLRPIANCYLTKAYITFGRFKKEILLERVV